MNRLKFISLILILLAIPLTVILAKQIQNYINHAAGPERKLVMGMSIYKGGYESRYSATKTLKIIDSVAGQIGQYPATWSIWTDFGDGSYTDEVNDASPNTRNTFPSRELLDGLTARNISPVIFMQSVGRPVYGAGDANNDPAAKRYSNASIANGSFDAYLTKWATEAKAYNKPVILRYDQEMNGNWFPWSKPVKDANLKNFKNLHNTPENFVKSWQHIYNVIHPIAPKVKFFWCPIVGSVGSFTNYFPGNAYVDYIGFDAYEKPDSIARTMLDLYDDPIKNLRTFSNKPIIIGETGVDLRFPNRSVWLTNGYPAIYNNFPDVKAIIYFNMGNWDLSANPEIRTAYKNLAAQARFQGRFPPFTASPPPTPKPNTTQTITPTPIHKPTLTPTPTPKPIITQNPTNSPTPPPGTSLKVIIGIDGIGVTKRIPLGGNKNPKHTTRDLNVSIYKAADNTRIYSSKQKFSYNSALKKFDSTFSLPNNFPSSTYNVYIDGEEYLLARYPGSVTINKGSQTRLDSANFTLITGDINKTEKSINKLNILDYNILLSCSIFSSNKTLCNTKANYRENSDLNDDGKVNENDFTLFLKELANQEGEILPGSSPTPTPTPRPSTTPTPTPPPGTYAATYTASSATDQTAALKSFIETNKGKRIALSGIIPVTLLGITLPAGSVTTIDFLPGAKIQGTLTGVHGILRFYTSWDVVLNDPTVYGTGYDWVGDQEPNQGEHGIYIDGGGRITINRPVIRDTRGDGIYIGYQAGKNVPAVGVVINNPNIERSSRNGISPVAGEVTIRGGHIDRSGLDSIDFEPNNDLGATSISGIVSDIRLTRHGDLPGAAAHGPYAIAAGGYSTATKKRIDIQRVTGDNMRMTIRNTAIVIIQNNISDVATIADFPGVGSLTFTNNTRITKQ